MKQKLFIIRKYVLATSAKEAIQKEKTIQVDDVWLDEEWKKAQDYTNDKKLGFKGS